MIKPLSPALTGGLHTEPPGKPWLFQEILYCVLTIQIKSTLCKHTEGQEYGAAFLTSLSNFLYKVLTESVSYMSSVNVLTVHLITQITKSCRIYWVSQLQLGSFHVLGLNNSFLWGKSTPKDFSPFEHKDKSLNYLGRTCQRVDWTDNQCVIVGSFSFPEESMSGSSLVISKTTYAFINSFLII